ncbi:MAG: AbrB/MazE/SpoVT family DNA-binding domain-containing protein [Chloroflexi bacterium]|nr:MAG: AbrB/MazE/SpoVT family DNA-binding domain-containing protein [Chloroflexota bacterium]HDN01262.1 AbrB/MazE/SpoVT family DNA-binding domain-containing protein [Deltaproteobacteria bacterium]
MRKKVNKWGNSLGLRIPKLVAAEVGLEENSLVNLTIVNGSIVISPERELSVELEEMLNQVTKESLHGEVNTGPAIGREEW